MQVCNYPRWIWEIQSDPQIILYAESISSEDRRKKELFYFHLEVESTQKKKCQVLKHPSYGFESNWR